MAPLHLLLSLLIILPITVILVFPLAAARVLRRSRMLCEESEHQASISLIIPFCGIDANALENIASLTRQAPQDLIEILICVEDPDDPIIPLVTQVIAEEDEGHVQLIVTGPSGSRLGKMHNIIVGINQASGKLLVLLDSDVYLPHEQFIQELVQPLRHSSIGLVTCFPAYRGASDLGSMLLAASINPDLLGYFTVIGLIGQLNVANGSCLAFRRDVLQEIGGIEFLESRMLMDTLLARRIIEQGYRIHLHHSPAPIICRHATVLSWWHQSHRWQVAMRKVLSGNTYFGFFLMRSWPLWALLLLLTGIHHFYALMIVGMAIFIRILSAIVTNRCFINDPSLPKYVMLLPLLGFLDTLGALYAIIDSRVVWRNRHYVIEKGGFAREMEKVIQDG